MPCLRRVFEKEAAIVQHLSGRDGLELCKVRVHRVSPAIAKDNSSAAPPRIPIFARVEIDDVGAELLGRVNVRRDLRAGEARVPRIADTVGGHIEYFPDEVTVSLAGLQLFNEVLPGPRQL